MCSMFFPRSSNRTRSPFSVSSFAAHPPEIPDPTTMASYDVDCTLPSAAEDSARALILFDRRGTWQELRRPASTRDWMSARRWKARFERVTDAQLTRRGFLADSGRVAASGWLSLNVPGLT